MTTISTSVPRPASGDAPLPVPPAMPRAGAVWRAMVWKECREIGVVALLILAATGVILGFMLLEESRDVTSPELQRTSYETAGYVFLSGPLSFIACIAGLVLGYMQFNAESRQDRFALIMHRPVSRPQLFRMKAAAGIGLYLAALLVPTALGMAWASRPYNIPLPFSWDMSMPALLDILAGIPFYFAGILVAQRIETRWVGARLLPAAAPVLAAVASYAMSNVAWALLIWLVALAVMATAAFGIYVAGGQYRPLGRLARGTLGLAILVTILCLGGIAVGLLGQLQQADNNIPNVQSPAPTYQTFATNGQPIIVHLPYTASEDAENWTITDLQGVVQPMPQVSGRHLKEADIVLPMYGLGLWRDQIYRPALHSANFYFNDFGIVHGTYWADGPDYMVGFSLTGRRRVGAIGARGFERDVAVPQARFGLPIITREFAQIGEDGRQRLISGGDTLYHLTPEIKLETVYKAPGTIRQMNFFGVSQENSGQAFTEIFPVVQTEQQVIVLSPGVPAKPLVQLDVDHPEQWYVIVGRIPSTGSFLLWTRPRADTNHATSSRAYYFGPDGKLDHQVELPNIIHLSMVGPRHNPVWDYAAPALAPAPLVDVGEVIDGARFEATAYYLDPKVLENERGYRHVAMFLSSIMGVLSALGMFLLARRRQLPRGATWMWTMLALLLGPATFLLLLCTRGVTLLGTCAACGKRGLVSSAACPHCGTAWAAPGRNGTEIFV